MSTLPDFHPEVRFSRWEVTGLLLAPENSLTLDLEAFQRFLARRRH